MKYLYYPGCSSKGTSRAYEESLLSVCRKLGIELEELEDWTCCGATSVVAVNKVLAFALSARNLALAEQKGKEMVTPCPSCWLMLTKANNAFREGTEPADKVREALAAGGLTYNGTVNVRHLMDFLVNVVGLEKVRKAVTNPLKGYRIAPYYGCQIVRPYAQNDDTYNPQNLEKIIEALGAEVAQFEGKTTCCSGALMATMKDDGVEMSRNILNSIKRASANIVVTPCPLCQLNLELAEFDEKQPWKETELPVLNLSQLVGLGLGLAPKELGLSRSILPGVEKKIKTAKKYSASLEAAEV
ncbi:MAG: CoB--CoM heterodisulfide reductase iron-sulfur subunit B family protein [Candidatus Eisenbacteria bacterium]|nr:CoB--CoM heterodisulfide reductase iron-sulfur subunit B family protein [Candidatus Eisenbacteria bacterium]